MLIAYYYVFRHFRCCDLSNHEKHILFLTGHCIFSFPREGTYFEYKARLLEVADRLKELKCHRFEIQLQWWDWKKDVWRINFSGWNSEP